MTVVMKLGTREKQVFTCSPREAVIAAYAQSRGDWNTWDYERRYKDVVQVGTVSVSCGDYSAWLDETQNNAERLAVIEARG